MHAMAKGINKVNGQGQCRRRQAMAMCMNEVNGQGQRRESKLSLLPGDSYSHGPFSGNPIQYKFVEFGAKLDMSKRLEKWQSTPTENRGYGHLSILYDQGYKMLAYISLPFYNFFNLAFDSDESLKVQKYAKFQGIFRKKLPHETEETWQLKVRNCMLTNRLSYNSHGGLFSKSESKFKRISDCRHILQTINEISQECGRLVGLQMVDFAGQQLEIEQFKAWRTKHDRGVLRETKIEVDVFYEVPLHSSPERYMYECVSCPIQANMEGTGWKVNKCCLQEVMDRFLGTGWRLVDVLCDNDAEQTTIISGFSAKSFLSQNHVWIFEKPKSREHDATPYYEITMAEHWLKVPVGKGYKGSHVELDEEWTTIITDMGQYGWEVAGVVKTPEITNKGVFDMKLWTKMWLFFQRPIQPPSYSDLFSTNIDT